MNAPDISNAIKNLNIPPEEFIEITNHALIESYYDCVLELNKGQPLDLNFEKDLSKSSNAKERQDLLAYFGKKSAEQKAMYPFFKDASDEYIQQVVDSMIEVLLATPSFENAQLKLNVFEKLFRSRDNYLLVATTIRLRNEQGAFTKLFLSDFALKGLDLSNTNLSNINLTGATLHGVNFSGANLWKANLSNAQLNRAIFNGCNASSANFTGATLEDATYDTKTSFFGAQISNEQKTRMISAPINNTKTLNRSSQINVKTTNQSKKLSAHF